MRRPSRLTAEEETAEEETTAEETGGEEAAEEDAGEDSSDSPRTSGEPRTRPYARTGAAGATRFQE